MRALSGVACVFGAVGLASVSAADGGAYAAFSSFTAPVPEASQYFGSAVAIDGDVIVVGANGEDDADSSSVGRGAVYVYRFDGSAWVFEQRLTASDGLDEDDFGFSVDIDGDLIVVGAREPFGPIPNRGAAYVFRYTDGVWNEEQILEPADVTMRSFGHAVSISGDVIAVGAGQSSVGSVFASGRVYMYRFDALSWQLEDTIEAAVPTPGLYFGDGVSVDGDTIAIGAPFQLSGMNAGLVGIYRYRPTGWLLEDAFFASDATPGDEFGASLSLDGDTVLVGAMRQFIDSGAAYRVRREPGTVNWNETQKLSAPGGLSNNAAFGASVALDGSTAVISRPLEFTPEPVGVYRDSGTALSFEDDLPETTVTGAFTRFGSSVDASGPWVVVGSFGHPEGALSLAGRVFVYYRDLVRSPDLDADGVVDSADLAVLLAGWGVCP